MIQVMSHTHNNSSNVTIIQGNVTIIQGKVTIIQVMSQ